MSRLRVLVIGARGFVGTALAAELLRRGHSVVALDSRGGAGRLAAIRDQIEWHTGDGSTLEAVLDSIGRRRIDAIYYGPFYRSDDYSLAREIDVMAAGALRVFELARGLPVRRVLFPSSTAVHGPQHDEIPVDEQSPLRPVGIYGSTKLLCEQAATAVNHAIGSNVITAIRLPSVYGPGAAIASRRVNVPAVQAARDQPAVVEYRADSRVCIAHVDDSARVLANVIEADEPRHTVYELGGLDTSFADIAAAVRQEIPGADIQFGSEADGILPHSVDWARGGVEFDIIHRPLADGMSSVIDYERARLVPHGTS